MFAITALGSVWIAGVGCSGSDDGGGVVGAADAATASDSAAAEDSPSSSDSGVAADTSSTTDTGAAADTGADGGIGYLQQCMTVGAPGDCAAGLTCKVFKGKQKNFCTKPCTTATAATDCPAPAKGCGGDGFCSPP